MWGRDLAKQRGEKHAEFLNSKLEMVGSSLDGQVDFFIHMMDEAGVDKLLTYANPTDSVAEMISGHRERFIPFAIIDLRKPEELEYSVNSLGFKGVAEVAPAATHFYIDDFELLDPLYKKAIDLDVPISWHLKDSFLMGGSRSVHSGDFRLQEVCFKYPQLKHIVCHLGNPDNYLASIAAFSGYQNVYFDLSGISTHLFVRMMIPQWGETGHSRLQQYLYPEKGSNPPADHQEVVSKVKSMATQIVREASNTVQDRLMFATDSPLSGREEIEMDICRDAFGHDDDLLQHILGLNAKRLLNL